MWRLLGFSAVAVLHVVEYPGYGEARGVPSAVSAVATVRDALGREDWDVVVGFSLGGMLLAEALQQGAPWRPESRLVLLNSATSLESVVRTRAGGWAAALLPLRLGSPDAHARLPARTVLVHSLEDAVIPFRVAQEAAARHNLSLVVLPSGSHGHSVGQHRALWLPLLSLTSTD